MKVTVLLAFTAFFSYIPFSNAQQKDENPPDSIEKFDVITIKQNRLKEKLKESPLTVESMGSQSIRETPASDFYEAPVSAVEDPPRAPAWFPCPHGHQERSCHPQQPPPCRPQEAHPGLTRTVSQTSVIPDTSPARSGRPCA